MELAVREGTSQSDPNGVVYVLLSCSCIGHSDSGYVENIRVRVYGGEGVREGVEN